MDDFYRVLVVEDDPDPTVYLRLVLLRSGVTPGDEEVPQAQQPARGPTRVQALLNGITSTISGVARIGSTGNPVPPVILIVDAAPNRREALSAFFRRAGCTTIALADEPASLGSPVAPDLLVLPGPAGPCTRGADTLQAQYPQCPVAITTVLDCVNQHHRTPAQHHS